MDSTKVEQIANAVLYEGYMLYPYRASSVKNKQRFNWGALAPKSFSDAQKGTEAWHMQTECLVIPTANARVHIKVRFLHLIDRQIGRYNAKTPVEHDRVPSLEVNGELYQAWQEARECEVELSLPIVDGAVALKRFVMSKSREVEEIRSAADDLAGIVVRQAHDVSGEVEATVSMLDGVAKMTIRVRNTTSFENAASKTREQALLRSLVATHAILTVENGEVVSLLEPDDRWTAAAAGCTNIGVYPVLVGEKGQRKHILASPIILYDYPEIAGESAGELFDSTEIDEILTLRIMTMTDDEKREMRSVDDRARRILERADAMTAEQLLAMHGTLRGLERSRAAGDG